MMKRKPDKWTKMAERDAVKIEDYMRCASSVPWGQPNGREQFICDRAATLRRLDRVAYRRGCHDGFLNGVDTQKMREGKP